MTDLKNLSVKLSGKTIELIPLNKGHFAELDRLAKDSRIWESFLFDGSDSAKLMDAFKAAISGKKKSHQYPFAIFHKKDKRLAGTTRFLDIQPAHRRLEIGATWLHPDYWATDVNLECKLLLLNYCFETLKTVRVQFRTDENNMRSRNAILKIGAQYEGIIRNDLIRENGTVRNSAYYSVIADEWKMKKNELTTLLKNKRSQANQIRFKKSYDP
ncbi:MAG TPA: GNAT family protein [Mucilaginibacter sp.]|jgi:RimJ/RimL family protein N-acetyltransferase|nr:GNAT family protein [Mucilaginibacter sp.]